MKNLGNQIEIINNDPDILPEDIQAIQELLGHNPDGEATDTYRLDIMMKVNSSLYVILKLMDVDNIDEQCSTGYSLYGLIDQIESTADSINNRKLQLHCTESGESHSTLYRHD